MSTIQAPRDGGATIVCRADSGTLEPTIGNHPRTSHSEDRRQRTNPNNKILAWHLLDVHNKLIMDLSHWIGSKRRRRPEQEFRFISTKCGGWVWSFHAAENKIWEAKNQSGKITRFNAIRDRDGFIEFLESHGYTGPHMPLDFTSQVQWGSPEPDDLDYGLTESDIARFEEYDDCGYWSGDPDWDN